mmetsp:Transcript_15795/g.20750  ORF Transcript_15795/g.20750 Transcript_15795/m.20750 type:complete len:105 (-) Transcript_15795:436-750(-)
MLFIPSIGPGYDDTAVRPWNDKNTKSRNGGKYYSDMSNQALKTLEIQKSFSVKPILTITSFNEWHEGSQIEPAIPKQGYKDYGAILGPNGYITLTNSIADRWRQ